MSRELMELQLLFGSGAWLTITILAGLFLALIFRPKSIQNLPQFRAACGLLAVSIVATPFLNILLSMLSMDAPGSILSSSSGSVRFLISAINAIGPVLLGASVFCGLFALIPVTTFRRDEDGPAKHPME